MSECEVFGMVMLRSGFSHTLCKVVFVCLFVELRAVLLKEIFLRVKWILS